MTAKTGMVEEFSFSSEDNIAGACSNALRRVRSLADTAPIGRLFASITTLSEATSQINEAMAASDFAAAASHMKKYGAPVAAEATPLPMHFKRRG
jgi:hypothetical protein